MAHSNPEEDKMIDLATKLPQSLGAKKKGRTLYRKHDAINLPRNLIDSDTEVEKSSSDDDNFTDTMYYRKAGPRMNKLSSSFTKMQVSERDELKKEALRELTTLQNKFRDGIQRFQNRFLKARSPFRNKLEEHKKSKPYDDEFKKEGPKHNMTVTTAPAMRNGGRVIVHSKPKPVCTVLDNGLETSFPSEDALAQEQLLNETLEDTEFMASLAKLTPEELDQVFSSYSEQEHHVWSAPQTYQQQQMKQQHQHLNIPVDTPASRMLSPVSLMSPSNLDLNDSSYETGSPCSTAVTSPGGFSPNRTSISSESEQEVESTVESSSKQMMRNVPVSMATRRIVVRPDPVMRPEPVIRPEPLMRPLGQAVNMVQTSATDRLLTFQNSTSFCRQQFIVQLVQVFMSASGPDKTDKVETFAKSLMSTMKMKIGARATESDIWQLSILAHIQFLLPRASEYCGALDYQDENGHSLLYLAAVQHYKKPLIARYIAESMMRLGSSPLQVDDKGNTVLHALAELGDTHVHVMAELLVALGTNAARACNKSGQTPLHVAMLSLNPHTSTTVVLLQKGANPLQSDGFAFTALHYHLKRVAGRLPRMMEDLELIRKMIHSPIAMTQESLHILEMVRNDPMLPADLSQLIYHELNKYCIKDVRPRKTDRRMQ